MAINKKLYVPVRDCQIAAEVWEALNNLFQDTGLGRRIGLLQKWCSVQLVECSSVEDCVNKIIATAQKLNDIEFNVNDNWIGSLLLKGLSSEYSTGKLLTADRR